MKKLTLTKAAAAVTAFAAALTAVTAVPAEMSARADDFPALMAAEEAAAWTEMLGRFGFDSVQELLSDSRALPNVSRIKDLDGNGAANVLDAQYIFQFLSGRRMYGYDYSELDVTNDFVLNSADAQAYLQYVAYYMVQELNAPFSAHGAAITHDSTYEYRTYVKCDYPAMTTITYTLGASGILTSGNDEMLLLPQDSDTRSTQVVDTDEEYEEEVSMNSVLSNDVWTPTYDTRIVRVGEEVNGVASHESTGFIIGTHMIATAGHCVYNRYVPNNNINPNRTVWAYTFTNNGTPVPHKLTVKSVHFLYNFQGNITNQQIGQRDYALIEVEQDLTSYGAFDLGMLTDNAPYSDNLNNDAVDLTIVQFRTLNSDEEESEVNRTPTFRDGWLSVLNAYRLHVAPDEGGVSGSVVYATNTDSTAVGIINSTLSGGMAMKRPLLHFYMNNPFATYYES